MSQLSGLRLARTARESAMASRQRGERRTKLRVNLRDDHHVTCTCEGQTCTGMVEDVSVAGARLVLTSGDPSKWQTDTRVELSIQTPWETVARHGRIAWTLEAEGSWHVGVEYVDLPEGADCVGLLNMDRVKIDALITTQLQANVALRRHVLPFAAAEGRVHVACLNPLDQAALQAVEKAVGLPVFPEPAEPDSLQRALDRVYGDPATSTGATLRTRSIDVRAGAELQSEDVVALCDEILLIAILRQASDVHIDPEQDGVQIRFRVDGVLEPYNKLPVSFASGMLSRYKVLSGMDIAEKRAPQDGAFKHRFGRTGQMLDLRVATLPTKYGERMTLRLLALQTELLTLERLGMSPHDLGCFQKAIDSPHGMILLTGPTGAGKTTTLYAAIRRLLGSESLNVITVEDPIEYEIKGVAQVEIDSADKVTFVKALRSVLRHDPDVVMIGEIRDAETADIAIKASLTGHLVFSTLHTNSAVSVITRLADIGVDRFLIAATLRLAVAQRLVRQLCRRCRQARPLTSAEAVALNASHLDGQTVYDPKGCIYCGGSGYAGRIGLFEMLPLGEEWSRLIARGAEESDLSTRMRELKIASLLEDGVAKALSGMTSVREVLGAVTIW